MAVHNKAKASTRYGIFAIPIHLEKMVDFLNRETNLN
jgi:hypothetical protein